MGARDYPTIENVLVPVSCFGRGELWLADPSGDHVLHGHSGKLLPIRKPCVQFSPRAHHATILVIGYHIRSPLHLLTEANVGYLKRVGFCENKLHMDVFALMDGASQSFR